MKVFNNLVKGLQRIGQPYVVNRTLTSTQHVWIHDVVPALLDLPRGGVTSVLGPNLVVLPHQLPRRKAFPRAVYVHPSRWVASLWREEGFKQCPIEVWPVGIDTDEFPARSQVRATAPVLVYYKERFPWEIDRLKTILRQMGVEYRVLVYGKYTQAEYMRRLHECSFVIWLGRQESQGIALQEALSVNVPVLVLDALSLFDCYPSPDWLFPERLRRFRTTTAPYFDARCGIVLDSMEKLEEGIFLMREHLSTFRPREFIMEYLSLERQARAFVDLLEALDVRFGSVKPCCKKVDTATYRPSLLTRLRLERKHPPRVLIMRLARAMKQRVGAIWKR